MQSPRLYELQQGVEKGTATMQDFFAVVKEFRRSPELLRQNAKILGELNREIFFKTHFVFPFFPGVILEVLVFAIGIWAGISAVAVGSSLLLFISQTLVVISMHPLSHLLAGYIMGIKFLGFYFNGPLKIEPGVKVDYETFLLRSGGERALFFIAGVLGTLVGAFGILALAYLYSFPGFIRLLLLGISLFYLVSEFFPLIFIRLGRPQFMGFSWRRGDLYKALRELK